MNRIPAFMIALALLVMAASGPVQAVRDENHPSVKAALACIAQIAPIVRDRRASGPDVSCDIPVALSEKDLDEIFKAAMQSTSMSDKMRGKAEKYSTKFAKTLTNFRGADCMIRLRVKRSTIIEALSADQTVIQLKDQPADCDVTTKKHQIKKLKFAFAPRIDMKGGCVEKFALNMGKIDAGCKVCFVNRLYLSTQLVGLWANHMSGNVTSALNAQLGGSCR